MAKNKTKFYHWRREIGYTQQEVCDLTNNTQSMISRIEDGSYMPSVEKRIYMARDLGVRIADLFDYLETRKYDQEKAANIKPKNP